ncbi:EthD domain-containing protein [Uliginosibacterium sp. 31-16]|uniref:EthD domain-containing protein n=1 Tax=Uliginosibacterium sp. 31-16 TaxID=3068315 RepID=UPI00273E7CAE|nr:EthD domain-containing protein [Uliginosibacterium sp. 31-16]MDP5239051.1 EthD domain-containing protein [Uliginosibacterium sp. 31-16]
MIKMIFCARRHPSLSREAFLDYWLNQHGPLFLKHAADYRALRYVQSHTLAIPLNEAIRASRGAAPEYDGVGEIWWASEEDFRAAVSSEAVQKLRNMFVEDEARFIDLASSSVFFTAEHVLLE